MKLAKRFAALLMGATLVLGSVAGLAACGESGNADSGTNNTQSAGDEQIRAVYDLYTANCAENNVTPQTYDEWLASIKGAKGDPGANGITPHIGDDDMWWIGDEPTGFKAVGKDGVTPSISSDGYWVFGETKTQYKAVAENGKSAYELYWQSYKGEGNPLSEEEWLASLKGDQGVKGDKGNGWLFGSGVPDGELGEDGDLYLDTFLWEVYTKTDGTWNLVGCIKADGTGGSEKKSITLRAGESQTVDINVETDTYELKIDVLSGEVTEWGLVANCGETAFSFTNKDSLWIKEHFYRLYDGLNDRYWGALPMNEEMTKLTFTAKENITFAYELVKGYESPTLTSDGTKYTLPTIRGTISSDSNTNRHVPIDLDESLLTGSYDIAVDPIGVMADTSTKLSQFGVMNSNGYNNVVANLLFFITGFDKDKGVTVTKKSFEKSNGKICLFSSSTVDYNVTLSITPSAS